MAGAALQPQYIRDGITFDREGVTIDLAEPRTVIVRGINSKTGEEKDYLLRVTQFGKLVLQ
jgi:hypothetical protein